MSNDGPAEFEMDAFPYPSGPFGWESCEWLLVGDENIVVHPEPEPYGWMDEEDTCSSGSGTGAADGVSSGSA